jgi:deoxyribodipyrimidine photo-lyase
VHTAIIWFRRDLRLGDNPALQRACQAAQRLIPLYIDESPSDSARSSGAASRWWLHHSLAALDEALRARGSRLILRRGEAAQVLRELIAEHGVGGVFWNRRYDPPGIARDTEIKRRLTADGVACESHNASLLFEPWTVLTGAGRPYRVFTPYWKACLQRGLGEAPQNAVPQLPPAPSVDAGRLDALSLLPRIRWDAGLATTWTPGEQAAMQRLQGFDAGCIARYPRLRDVPGAAATSRLSPHLHFGEIGPRQVVWAVRAQLQQAPPGADDGAETLLRELGWREFAHHVLYHFPHTPERPLDARFETFPWRCDGAQLFEAWQRGRTGYPIVDAGMRELWHSGWMHNRVRMVAASFLTKNCRLPWQDGARWFWDTLVDADLANNTLGWQWASGCGADAAPYFRIFNPVRQGERFDPEGEYVRRWLPELAPLPARWIHRPWEMPREVANAVGVRIGQDYPLPIVELSASRDDALAAYRSLARARGS